MANRNVEGTYPGIYRSDSDPRSVAQDRQAASAPASTGLILLLPLLALCLVGVTVFSGWVFLQRMERLYRGHIYPHVYALGVDLGGMKPEEAARALEGVAEYVDTGLLVLTDGDRQWSYPWSKAGLRVDVEGTARAAYDTGRGGGWRAQAEVWLNYHDVAPRFLFDATAARALLEDLSEEVSQPVIDAAIELEQGEVVVVPGQTGRVLDLPTTLARMREASGGVYRVEVPLAFQLLDPVEVDATDVVAQAERLLSRQMTITTYDVLTDEIFSWPLGREEIGNWLYLVPGEGGEPIVDVNAYAIRDTLMALADEMGQGRGFRYDEAAETVFQAFDDGVAQVRLYMTHPERVYVVEPGDTLTSLSAKFGMPPGLVAEANRDIDVNRLQVGQEILIPSQDILTPHMPVLGKKIVVDLAEQRTRVYENGQLLWDWAVSTGIETSPTHRGTFQVLEKHEEAYASQWDLWMPYFISVYSAGGGVENGFHELPILSSGARLWEGNLGQPASYGCIILGIPAAETLYNWAEIGTTVEIH
ncbi:MAG: L,D-transpeptidase family protein [Anaerolineae bacterium]